MLFGTVSVLQHCYSIMAWDPQRHSAIMYLYVAWAKNLQVTDVIPSTDPSYWLPETVIGIVDQINLTSCAGLGAGEWLRIWHCPACAVSNWYGWLICLACKALAVFTIEVGEEGNKAQIRFCPILGRVYDLQNMRRQELGLANVSTCSFDNVCRFLTHENVHGCFYPGNAGKARLGHFRVSHRKFPNE